MQSFMSKTLNIVFLLLFWKSLLNPVSKRIRILSHADLYLFSTASQHTVFFQVEAAVFCSLPPLWTNMIPISNSLLIDALWVIWSTLQIIDLMSNNRLYITHPPSDLWTRWSAVWTKLAQPKLWSPRKLREKEKGENRRDEKWLNERGKKYP